MDDSKRNKPKPPPADDFSKTTPNIDAANFDDNDDWAKTRYDTPKDAPADEWGKTVINYNVSAPKESSFGKEQHPSEEKVSEADWGMTKPNLRIDEDFKSSDVDDDDSGMTVAYVKLPEADQKKYQNIPPTPTERARKEEEKRKKAGGIPVWFWVSAGLMTLFSFTILILLGAYFLFTGSSSFTLRVKGAEPNSQFFVDRVRWGVDNPAGAVDLHGLEPGTRKILVRKKGFSDFEKEIKGDRGEIVPVIVVQRASPNECENAESLTNVNKREECANIILNNLDSPPEIAELLRSLNLYYINFASGQYTIPEPRKKFLLRASTYIQQLPVGTVIEIGGHTDNVGDDESNLVLSKKRAESVKSFFVENGIEESRFTIKGYGDSAPKESNDTESGRFQNRRIAYKVVSN